MTMKAQGKKQIRGSKYVCTKYDQIDTLVKGYIILRECFLTKNWHAIIHWSVTVFDKNEGYYELKKQIQT